MKELKKSYGRRRSDKGGRGKITVDFHCPPEDVDRTGLRLSFETGDPKYLDRMEIVIDADDFPLLMEQMAGHNRKAFLEALDYIIRDDAV